MAGQTTHRALKRNISHSHARSCGRILLASSTTSARMEVDEEATFLLTFNDMDVDGKNRALFLIHSRVISPLEISLCGCDLCRLQNVWCRVIRCGESKTKIFVCARCEAKISVISR